AVWRHPRHAGGAAPTLREPIPPSALHRGPGATVGRGSPADRAGEGPGGSRAARGAPQRGDLGQPPAARLRGARAADRDRRVARGGRRVLAGERRGGVLRRHRARSVTKGRLEAFSDGVIAIIITIMVLELRTPHSTSWVALKSLWPQLLMYVLSFTFLATSGNNPHPPLHVPAGVNGTTLWATQHLLFWLPLPPFPPRWVGESHLEPLPVAAYGVVLLMSAIAFTLLVVAIVRREGPESTLGKTIGNDLKGRLSVAAY